MTVHAVLWVSGQRWQRMIASCTYACTRGSPSSKRVGSGPPRKLGQSCRRDRLRRSTGRRIVTDGTEGGSKAIEFIFTAKEVFDQVDGPPAVVLVGNRDVDGSWIGENHP